MKYPEISEANKKLNVLKEKFRFYQIGTEICKSRIYDPYDNPDIDKKQWEMYNQYEILDNRCVLKNLENEIKEVRKLIKKLNQKQNIKEHQ